MSSVSESWDTDDDPEDDDPEDDAADCDLDALLLHSAATAAPDMPLPDLADATVRTLLFTAANPPGTVSVTAMLDGTLIRVDLSADAVEMTERELAEEILLVSSLAQLQAGAARHTLVAEFMTRLGPDRVAVAANLEHEIGLPSPQTVREKRIAAFAARSHVYGY